MTLYEIDENIRLAIEAMLNSVDEETGEVNMEAADALNALQAERKTKLENTGCYIKNLEAEVAAIKAEADVLKKRAAVKERAIERLKDYVATSLLSNGETKMDAPRVCFSFRKSEKVVIKDMDAIPEAFLRKTVKVDPDLTAIKKAITAGEDVSFAELVKKQNLQIK